MLARIQSCAVHGIDGVPLAIEVDNSPGKTEIFMVGLPDAAVRESKDRVISALKNSGFRFPRGHTVISLAPAHIKKEGSALDLPIALGMLTANDQIASDRLEDYIIVGELALDGSLRPVTGALCMALSVRERGLKGILLPQENAEAAGIVPDIDVLPVRHLREAVEFITGEAEIEPLRTDPAALMGNGRQRVPDLSDVKGQAHVKRALTVAAAGGHNLLMVGPPGTGKTMLASRIPGILPDMTFDEALETTRVYSVATNTSEKYGFIAHRPFRSPHHTATTVSIVGGGASAMPNPGEVSMAHNGVLFLDELPEFNRAALEVLRQPLEEGLVHIRRANYAITYPSSFMLVVAMNPCPCGCLTDPMRECRCSQGQIHRYMSRLSGPLLDRIDLHIDVPALSYDEIADPNPSGPTSAEVRQTVQAARDRQRARYKGAYACNGKIDAPAVRKYCAMTPGAEAVLQQAMERMGLSARAYDKVLRVARTLADLEEAETIGEHHVAEAVQYRTLDRGVG